MLKLKDEAYGKENSVKSLTFKRQSTEDLATAGEVWAARFISYFV